MIVLYVSQDIWRVFEEYSKIMMRHENHVPSHYVISDARFGVEAKHDLMIHAHGIHEAFAQQYAFHASGE